MLKEASSQPQSNQCPTKDTKKNEPLQRKAGHRHSSCNFLRERGASLHRSNCHLLQLRADLTLIPELTTHHGNAWKCCTQSFCRHDWIQAIRNTGQPLNFYPVLASPSRNESWFLRFLFRCRVPCNESYARGTEVQGKACGERTASSTGKRWTHVKVWKHFIIHHSYWNKSIGLTHIYTVLHAHERS